MLTSLINLLFPPQCLNCRALVPVHGTLCVTCWSQVRFITEPMCICCGLPFDFALGEGALCGECMRAAPTYAKARAVFRYDEHSRPLVLSLKYRDQTYLAAVYGTWLAKAGKELVMESDVIVPVPLHYWRLIGRRYNQSALLAQILSRRSGLPAIADGLKRTRATLPQAGLTRKQREDNVKGAFAINPKRLEKIKNKSVLLIDDVMTTSATIEACAAALMKAGAMRVNVLTLAKRAD